MKHTDFTGVFARITETGVQGTAIYHKFRQLTLLCMSYSLPTGKIVNISA